MGLIEVGVVMGVILFLTFAILVEKLPMWLKRLVLGHYLLSDIIFTVLSFIAFPIVGAATLISAGIFCILISSYLIVRRASHPYTRIELRWPTIIKIVSYQDVDNEHSNDD